MAGPAVVKDQNTGSDLRACLVSIGEGRLGPHAVQSQCRVALTLIDEGTGKPISGVLRVRLRHGAQSIVEPRGLESRGRGLDPTLPIGGWYVVPGRAELELPLEPLQVEAIAGVEMERAAVDLDLADGRPREVRVPLRRLD